MQVIVSNEVDSQWQGRENARDALFEELSGFRWWQVNSWRGEDRRDIEHVSQKRENEEIH